MTCSRCLSSTPPLLRVSPRCRRPRSAGRGQPGGQSGPRSALGGQNLKCWFPGVLEFKFSLFQRLKRIVNCRGAAWGCSVRKRVWASASTRPLYPAAASLKPTASVFNTDTFWNPRHDLYYRLGCKGESVLFFFRGRADQTEGRPSTGNAGRVASRAESSVSAPLPRPRVRMRGTRRW